MQQCWTRNVVHVCNAVIAGARTLRLAHMLLRLQEAARSLRPRVFSRRPDRGKSHSGPIWPGVVVVSSQPAWQPLALV